jgi:DNA-binding response OmpR family regulator
MARIRPKGRFRVLSSGQPRAAHILLAEDDFEMRRLLCESLRAAGHSVLECEHGTQLAYYLGFFSSSQDIGHFDLVISDVRMSGLTGLGVLRLATQREGCPPMILITAFGDEETHAEAYRLGAAAVFDKPFNINVLLDEIDTLLARVSPRADPNRGATS